MKTFLIGLVLLEVTTACTSMSEFAGARVLRFTQVPFSPRTKIFLVAGAVDSANFAQEVLDQRRLWLSRGVSPDEIACYYSQPPEYFALQDIAQFQAVADELSFCNPANMAVLSSHLKVALAQKPPYIYLYVTSHGNPPLAVHLPVAPEEDKEALRSETARFPFLDAYFLQMHSLPDGHTHFGRGDALLTEIQQGKYRLSDIMVTPEALLEALGGQPKTRKIIVLQGCFSGGFLLNADTIASSEPMSSPKLSHLQNVTVLTASDARNPSFGCSPGEGHTYFGEAVLRALEASRPKSTPDKLNWDLLSKDIRDRVANKENEMQTGASNPMYFTNVRN